MSKPSFATVAVERLMREETLRALDDFEARLAREGRVPDADRLLMRRFGWVIQYAGACALGLLIAAVTLLINFLVFNVILHI